MNAVEYFKKNGFNKSKIHLDIMNAENWHNGFYNDLKRLVESWELVECVGGLNSAKANINEMIADSGEGYVSDNAKLYDYDFSFGLLRKAIRDVESVGGGL